MFLLVGERFHVTYCTQKSMNNSPTAGRTWVQGLAGAGPFCAEFACPPILSSLRGLSSFLPQSKNKLSKVRLLRIARRCACEPEWLFVHVCQPYNELAAYPGCQLESTVALKKFYIMHRWMGHILQI